MTELQRALAGINPPKVDARRHLQGAQYRGSTQQAKNIDTTLGEATGSVLGILKGSTTLYGNAVQKSWNEAEQTFKHAQATGQDPMELAKEKAREEASGLVGTIVSGAKEAIGLDPMRYSKTVTAANTVRDELFGIDEDIRIRTARGDFKSEDEMFKAREEARNASIAGVAESLGIDPKDPFYLDGAAKYDEQSRMNLRLQLAQTTEQMLIESNRKTLNADAKVLLDNGVSDPAVYFGQLQDARTNGYIRNDNEAKDFWDTLINSAAERGDANLVNSLFNQEMTINGYSGKYGDSLTEAERGAIAVKADDAFIANNAEIFKQVSSQMTNIQLKSAQGNIQGALSDIARLEAWAGQHQTSGRVTALMRQLESAKAGVLENQMRFNAMKHKEQKGQADQLALDADAQERLLRMMNGEAVSVDPTKIAHQDKATMDRAARNIYDAIEADTSLTAEQKVTRKNALLSGLSSDYELFDAVKSSTKRDLGDMNNAVVLAAKTGQASEMPKGFQGQLNAFNQDPIGWMAINGEDAAAIMSPIANEINAVGWDGFIRSKQGRGVDADAVKEIDAELDRLKGRNNWSDAEVNARRTEALINKSATGGESFWGGPTGLSAGEALSRVEERRNKVTTKIGLDSIHNTYLAANNDQKTIPAVTTQLKLMEKQVRDSNPDTPIYLQEQADGSLAFVALATGVPLKRTHKNELYRSYVDGLVTAEKDELTKLKEARKERDELNTQKAELTEKLKSNKPYHERVSEMHTPKYQK